jgi:hypothetical protein
MFDFLKDDSAKRYCWRPMPNTRPKVEHLSPAPLELVDVVAGSLSEALQLLACAQYPLKELFLISAVEVSNGVKGTLEPKFQSAGGGSGPTTGAPLPAHLESRLPASRWIVERSHVSGTAVRVFDDYEEALDWFARSVGSVRMLEASDVREIRSRTSTT